MVYKTPRREVGRRLDVTFADEIYAIAETQTTYLLAIAVAFSLIGLTEHHQGMVRFHG